MSPSPKGRVLGPQSARAPLRSVTGVCAWCGWEIFTPQTEGVRCLRCKSDEIDWVAPPAAPPPHVVTPPASYVPGAIALAVAGVTRRRRG